MMNMTIPCLTTEVSELNSRRFVMSNYREALEYFIGIVQFYELTEVQAEEAWNIYACIKGFNHGSN